MPRRKYIECEGIRELVAKYNRLSKQLAAANKAYSKIVSKSLRCDTVTNEQIVNARLLTQEFGKELNHVRRELEVQSHKVGFHFETYKQRKYRKV